MLQRLGLAAVLLGDPPILVLDEPLNGLDPEGIMWFRGLMRRGSAVSCVGWPRRAGPSSCQVTS